MNDVNFLTGGSTTKFYATSAKLVLQTLNNATVHLKNSALAQIKRRPDLFHR